jgi:hypothetical protein
MACWRSRKRRSQAAKRSLVAVRLRWGLTHRASPILAALGLVLIGGGHLDEGIKIMTTALDHFPIGNGGQDGALEAKPSALILSGF